MSLYGDYVQEICNKEIVEDSCGFATFFKFKDGLYIEDIFVLPSFRKAGHASHLADLVADIARERGIKKLYGSVKPSNNNSTASLKVLLGYGFQLDSSAIDAIAFVKEL